MSYNVNNALEIADFIGNIIKPNQALVNVLGKSEDDFIYKIGIATENERGYHKTNMIVPRNLKYYEIGKLVDEANALLFPDREPKENYLIVSSSMHFK